MMQTIKNKMILPAVLLMMVLLMLTSCGSENIVSSDAQDREPVISAEDSRESETVSVSGEIFNTAEITKGSEKNTVSSSENEQEKATVTESEETEEDSSTETETVEIIDSSENMEADKKSPAKDTSSDETVSLPEEEPLTEDPDLTEGLAMYFRHRLAVDPEKTKSYLNVRREPSEESDILEILFPNEVATYLSKRGDWYEIQCDGFTGYVSSDFVLTDSKAFEASKHSIGYAAMILDFDTILYEYPDVNTPGIRLAEKADVYTVSGVTGEFYQLDVVSEYVNHLYVKQDQALLFYQFLGPNANNGLDEGTEAYLASFDLGSYQATIDRLVSEAEVEKVEREQARIAYEEAVKASEAASIEASIRAEEEARASQAEEAEHYRQSVEASIAAAASQASREEASRAESQAAAARTTRDQAVQKEQERRNFTASHGAMTSANVQRSGEYAVNLDQGVIDYTIQLCNSQGLDPAVIFSVIYHESRFHPNSVNTGTGAAMTYGREGMTYGLMQIMPIWNKNRIIANNISYPDGLYDPYNNILIGVLLLKDQGAGESWVNALSRFRSGSLCEQGYSYALSVLTCAKYFDKR